MYLLFLQFSRSSGPLLLSLYVDLLGSLLWCCDQVEQCNQQNQEGSQAESDLFMDMEDVVVVESADDKVEITHHVPIIENEVPTSVKMSTRKSHISFAELFNKANNIH